MGLRNLKLDVTKGGQPTDPLEIFKGLTLRGSVENIWGPQEAALRDWHENRANSDVVVQMNTGGGKTLVGLLIAQSLVNETGGHVLYVCANNQLIEQTIQKALESGLSLASRYKSQWCDESLFDSGRRFCITNYATVFNGRSVLKDKSVDAVVFDDAHVAENIMRSHFTVRIKGDTKLFTKITNVFRPHFAKSCQSTRFEDACNGKWDALVFVPMYVVYQYAAQLRAMLIKGGVEREDEWKFSWEHIKDHLEVCCVLISGTCIEITPSVMPLHTTQYFAETVRRVYLTATMPTQTGFLRAFGVRKPKIVRPEGKSGDAQRLILFAQGEDDEDRRQHVLALIGDRKSCVISPSYTDAKRWIPPAEIYETDSGQAGIDEFVKDEAAKMLALVARYDGIDLPGSACRILVLDTLPRGESLFDRFIDQGVQIETLRSRQTAIRIVQAIGRIFRSNTDHGIVILRTSQLQSWVLSTRKRALLPALLQKQLQLGHSLQEEINKGEVDYQELIEGVLEGKSEWDMLYKSNIDKCEVQSQTLDEDWCCNLLAAERDAYTDLWDGQFGLAAEKLETIAQEATQNDDRLGAWYWHWAGLARFMAGGTEVAMIDFQRAANVRSELGRPTKYQKLIDDVQPSSQAETMFALHQKHGLKWIIERLSQIQADLVYGEKTRKAEEALKNIGFFLGLDASRPCNEQSSGPDVLWIGEGDIYGVSFELKTNKKQDGEYSKSDIKDCNDHREWLNANHVGKHFIELLVGPELKVVTIANPGGNLHIVTVESLQDLTEKVAFIHEQLAASGCTNARELEAWLRSMGLIWPQCVDALPNRLAIDLKDSTS